MARDTDLFQGLRELQFPGRPKRRRRWLRTVLTLGLVVSILVVGMGAYVWIRVQSAFDKAEDSSIVVDPALPPGEPLNILVLGSDSREVVSEDQRDERQFRGGEGAQRSDTIILIHLSGDREKAVLVHFPRDLRVAIDGGGPDKINSAYYGGPNKVIRTLREYTGLTIQHYVEVNFASFQNIVNAVGGVRMCVDRDYDDPKSGLKIPKPGCYDFDGAMALSFARARVVDPDGDFGRIRRQQRLIRELMTKVTNAGFLLNVPRLLKTVDAVGEGLRIDANLTVGLMRQIANRLSGFNQRSVDFRVVPSYPDMIGSISYVIARQDEADQLFTALREDTFPLPPVGKTSLSIPDPEDVSLGVLNGTDVEGLAREEADRLEEAGFDVDRIDSADEPVEATQILYQPGAELKVSLVRSWLKRELGIDIKPRESVREKLRQDVVVIVGPDIASIRATQSPSPSPSG